MTTANPNFPVPNYHPIYPESVIGKGLKIVNADGTAEKDAFTHAGANGSRCDGWSATSDDTSAVILKISINDGTTSYQVGEVTVPAGAGTNGTEKAKKVLNLTDLPWLDQSGSIFMPPGWKITVAAKVAVTAGKTVSLVSLGGGY